MRAIAVKILCVALLFSVKMAAAETFQLPKKGNDIVGQVQTAVVQRGDNFASIASRYNVTYTGLMESNPNVNPSNPGIGTVLIVPSAYVLPDEPRKGIIINLAELRLYYYPAHENVVMTYPVGIGVENWVMPTGAMKIVEKKKDPTWYVPKSVHAELAAKGFNLPNMIPPGPDNPLGGYMLRLSDRTFLIHGVVDPTTVGRRSSSGCIRMYPANIVELFNTVPVGTPVRVINEPYKVGWEDGQLYLEAHLPLQEQQVTDGSDNTPLVQAINEVIKSQAATIDWDKAFSLGQQSMGLPEAIGKRG